MNDCEHFEESEVHECAWCNAYPNCPVKLDNLIKRHYPTMEIAGYYGFADSDTVKTCRSCHGYTEAMAQHAAAECAYIKVHHALPEWSRYIERFEIIDDGFLFIHADPDALN